MPDRLYRETKALIDSSNLYNIIRDEPEEDGFVVGAIRDKGSKAYALEVSQHSPPGILICERDRKNINAGSKIIFNRQYRNGMDFRRDLATIILGYLPPEEDQE